MAVLEIKTVASSQFDREWAPNGDAGLPPLWILLQLSTQMMLANAEFGVVAALVIGDFRWELHIYDVARNRGTEAKIVDAVKAFWNSSDKEIAFDYSRDASVIKALYPRAQIGKVIDLRGNNRVVELLEKRRDATAREDAAAREAQACETEFRALIGDAESATCDGWSLTCKTVERKAYVVDATSFRQLQISELK